MKCDHLWKDKAVELSWARLCIHCGKIEQIDRPKEDYDQYVERRREENKKRMLKIVKKD